MDTKQRFLDHILGFGDAAEHPVGDRKRDRPQLVKQSLAIGHAAAANSGRCGVRAAESSANPCRQLGCASAMKIALGLGVRRTAELGHRHHSGLPGE